MTVEIGSLVVRATFGSSGEEGSVEGRLSKEMSRLRRELLDEMQEMLVEAERRGRER